MEFWNAGALSKVISLDYKRTLFSEIRWKISSFHLIVFYLNGIYLGCNIASLTVCVCGYECSCHYIGITIGIEALCSVIPYWKLVRIQYVAFVCLFISRADYFTFAMKLRMNLTSLWWQYILKSVVFVSH